LAEILTTDVWDMIRICIKISLKSVENCLFYQQLNFVHFFEKS